MGLFGIDSLYFYVEFKYEISFCRLDLLYELVFNLVGKI